MVRLERGGGEFLALVAEHFDSLGLGQLFSPALYPGVTRSWRRAGFRTYAVLDIMERSLSRALDGPGRATMTASPDWDQVLAVDRAAFGGFWAMSRLGLEEAYTTNRDTVLFEIGDRDGLCGYAIVGSQSELAYLHRIAVHPARAGAGMGTSLMEGAMGWARASGNQTMVLNVQPENTRARLLYDRLGFAATGSTLEVMCHGDCPRLLN